MRRSMGRRRGLMHTRFDRHGFGCFLVDRLKSREPPFERILDEFGVNRLFLCLRAAMAHVAASSRQQCRALHKNRILHGRRTAIEDGPTVGWM